MPEKQMSYESTDHWDFDDTPHSPPFQQQQQDQPTDPPSQKPPPQQTKRRITFGEVVVRDSSKSPSIIDVAVHPSTPTDTTDPTAMPKKSRFIVEDLETSGGGTPNSIMLATPTDTPGDYLTYGSTSSSSSSSNKDRPHRYSAQFPPSAAADNDRPPDSILTASSSRHLTEMPLSPLSRVSSYDSICGKSCNYKTTERETNPLCVSIERKSRFEVQHTPEFVPVSISRESSHSSLQQQQQPTQKLGRFSVEKTTTTTMDPGKMVGRFELSGTPDLVPQMELLLKQMDAQKSVLQDMMHQVNTAPRSRAVSISEKRRLEPSEPQR
jgi:hypothetical protein